MVVRTVSDIRIIAVLYNIHFHLSILEALSVRLRFLILVCTRMRTHVCVCELMLLTQNTTYAQIFAAYDIVMPLCHSRKLCSLRLQKSYLKCHTELHVNVLHSFFELLQHLSAGTEDTGDEKDPDALQDPVYHINIQQYLTEFLQSFSQQPYFHAFLQHLNKQEKQVLESIGVRT